MTADVEPASRALIGVENLHNALAVSVVQAQQSPVPLTTVLSLVPAQCPSWVGSGLSIFSRSLWRVKWTTRFENMVVVQCLP